MKDYKKIVFVFFVFFGLESYGQASYSNVASRYPWFLFWMPSTYTIINESAIALRATVIAEQEKEKGYLEDHLAALEELHVLEEEYQSKISSKSFSTKTSAFLSISLFTVEQTENKIQELLADITTINSFPGKFKYGLGDMEGRLNYEQNYIDEIQGDYPWLAGSVAFGGGAGYTYTAVLKILIRVIEIKRNVYEIEKEIKNLSTLNGTYNK